MLFAVLCITAFLILVIVVGYSLYIVLSSPGREKTIDQGGSHLPTPVADSQLEPLHSSWDSEAYADWPVAELLASMSATSYLPPVDAEPAFRSLGFKEVISVVDASMIGYVASSDAATVVVFRGTDNDIDWLVNLSATSVQTPYGSIHRGFHNAYKPLKPQIIKALTMAKSKHLWITGHSLGGALAVICASDLVMTEKLDLDGVITFGQPMVAKRRTAKALDKLFVGRFAHYVNENDIVPRVPPNFSHFGSLVWFTAGGIQRSEQNRLAFGATENQTGTPAEGAEVQPLSEQEFEELKASLRENRAEPVVSPDGSPIYEARHRLIEDHNMNYYLEKIRSVRTGIN